MKLWKRTGSVALSLALCAGLVLPALAHTVTIDGQTDTVATVQAGVDAIGEGIGTITMTENESDSRVTISGGNVTLDLNGNTLTGGNDGIRVSGGELTLKDSGVGGTVSGIHNGVAVTGGTANITGGTVSSDMVGVSVSGGTANITGGTVSSDMVGVSVSGGNATITGGEVSGGMGGGVVVDDGGTADISGNATVSGLYGVMSSGNANISGSATVSGNSAGVAVSGGTTNISGSATVSGDTTAGVAVGKDGTAAISGGTVSGNTAGMTVNNGNATLSGGAVSGKTGVHIYYDGKFTMNGGTVGSTEEGGAAIEIDYGDGSAVKLEGGTIYGEVPEDVNTDNVTVKDAPYVPPAPAPGPGPDPASDPLTRPAAVRTLLEELFRRAGGSGGVWTWAVENGLVDEDGDGDEIVTVALLRAILTRYAQVFGGNAVAVEDLTTLTGEDTDIVGSCRAVLNEFFGE